MTLALVVVGVVVVTLVVAKVIAITQRDRDEAIGIVPRLDAAFTPSEEEARRRIALVPPRR
jgi:hypothetical protein